MKFFKKTTAIFTAFLLIFINTSFAKETVTVTLGSYVKLGSYMGEDIIWRCIALDNNGALLISRDILCFKAFSDGNGLWKDSFLRTWLNSNEEHVNWNGNPPDAETVNGNAYDTENGFLYGFTKSELKVIKAVDQRSVLNVSFVDSADDGNEVHVYNSNGLFSAAVQNYTNAYVSITADRVFCPNLTQMEALSSNYPSEIIAFPTKKALEQSGNIKNTQNRSNSIYWLCDGIGNEEFPESVRCVYPEGKIFFSDAFDSSIGVRPAIYIEKTIAVQSGNGYENSPYTVDAGSKSSTPSKGSPNKISDNKTLGGITEGDYVVMGSHNGKKILWRCIEINENGPLMLSSEILAFHAFDASGHDETVIREYGGSNNWAMSNLRFWLNSDDAEGEKNWPCGISPLSDRTRSFNGYAMAKGFLCGFSPEEKEMIKPSIQKTFIHPMDIDQYTVGSEALIFKRNINSPSNFDTAYSAFTQDKIFLLSIEEAKKLKENFGDFYLAMPSAQAVSNNEAPIDGLSADRTAAWWLRDAAADSDQEAYVRFASRDGWVDMTVANSPYIGIRPAMYLNMDKTVFTGGSGTFENPYTVMSHSFNDWTITKEASCANQGIKKRTCQICGETEEEKLPALGHNFSKTIKKQRIIYTDYVRQCSRCNALSEERKLNGVLPAAAIVIGLILILFTLKKRQ